jgi:hypothetical protein
MIRDWARRAVLTRIVCALALFMLGFTGHAFADPTFDPFDVQYQLPDGSYSALCQPGEEKGGAPHSDHNHCDMCVMAAGHLFTPAEVVVAAAPALQHGEAIPTAAIVNLKRILSHHGLSRGPPLAA